MLSHCGASLGEVTTDERIHRVARLGLVTWSQLLSAGVTEHEVIGRLDRGSLRWVHDGVYSTFGTPLGYDARLLGACLAAGDGAVAISSARTC